MCLLLFIMYYVHAKDTNFVENVFKSIKKIKVLIDF